ncbi:MAG: L,D-transpeptidase [Chloroflexota bacterium]|nr:L,D-transpeptidase [Chloroflexota bacterium]
MLRNERISRREFLAISALALGGLAFNRTKNGNSFFDRGILVQEDPPTPEFPENIQLGRMCVGEPGANVDIKSEPYWNAPSSGTAFYDDVFLWKQEVIARQLDQNRINQRWVETPEGYIYADYLQKVKHIPQEPLNQLPETPDGGQGMWIEVFTPFTGLDFVKPPSQHWARAAVRPRIYYSQVFWAFNIRRDPVSDTPQYLLKQLHGAFDDAYWVDASICRQITPEEIAPINPDAEDKRIVVDLNYQTLTCLEGDQEVFFTKVTTGGYNYEEEKWLTPLGAHTIWRKMVSTHMSAGEAVGNYDIPGVAWTTLFDNNGAAVHATYWHNYYGTARSHGCVNSRPEDAKWVWRWTQPAVPYYPGELTIQGMNKSTIVEVVAA